MCWPMSGAGLCTRGRFRVLEGALDLASSKQRMVQLGVHAAGFELGSRSTRSSALCTGIARTQRPGTSPSARICRCLRPALDALVQLLLMLQGAPTDSRTWHLSPSQDGP